MLGASNSNHHASNYTVILRPWQEVLPMFLLSVASSIFSIYLILVYGAYVHYKKYLQESDFIATTSFVEYTRFTAEEIKKRKLKFKIMYLSQKEVFLTPSYLAKKILKKKINVKIQELKLLKI